MGQESQFLNDSDPGTVVPVVNPSGDIDQAVPAAIAAVYSRTPIGRNAG